MSRLIENSKGKNHVHNRKNGLMRESHKSKPHVLFPRKHHDKVKILIDTIDILKPTIH